MDSRSLNTPQPSAQEATKPTRRRYGPDFVGPRLPRGRQADPVVAFEMAFPPLVTRGESINLNVISSQNDLFCKIDWLTFTTLWDNTTAYKNIDIGCPFDGSDDSEYINDVRNHMTYSANFDGMYACLHEEFRGPVKIVSCKQFDYCSFASNASFVDQETGERVDFMKIGYHVDKDAVVRWVFQISGDQCKYFDWAKVKAHLETTQSTITRIDLAVDDLSGAKSYDLCEELYKAKRFTNSGRNPKHRFVGGDDGRSFYVGKFANGKELCVYEKGKESHSVDHPDWVRWEQTIGNKDRVIPYDALTSPEAYFLGAHAVFKEVFPDLKSATIEKIRICTKQKVKNDVGHFLKHASISCGKGVDTLRKKGIPDSVIVDHLARSGTQLSVGQPSVEDLEEFFTIGLTPQFTS